MYLTHNSTDAYFQAKLHTRSKAMCGKRSVTLAHRNQPRTETVTFNVRCNSWDCPVCSRKKAEKVRNKLRQALQQKGFYMLTLTIPHERDPQTEWRELGSKWNALMTKIRRADKNALFVRIVEPHRSNPYPHLHIIIRARISRVTIALWAQSIGFGKIKDWRDLYSDKVDGYLAKYLSKPWTNREAEFYRKEAHARRVSVSRAFGAIFAKEAKYEAIGKISDFQNTRFAAAENMAIYLGGTLFGEFTTEGAKTTWRDTSYFDPYAVYT